MSSVYFLKILLVFQLTVWSNVGTAVEGNTIAQYASAVTKFILKARSLPFEDCGSRHLILFLSISSCNTIPCVMSRGAAVQVNVLFDDDGSDTSLLRHSVHWIFNAVQTDAYITPDPCDGDHQCLKNDSDGKSYWATVHVNSDLPVITGTMQWVAVNQYNQKVLCFKVPVLITMPQRVT